jgi:YD repeat-containing protein
MKTKHYINLFIALTLALSACKKNSGGDATPTPTVKKYLVQATVKAYAGGIGIITTTTDYTYDSKKRKQTEKASNSTFTYAYYDNDKLFSSTQTFGDGNALRIYIEYKYTGDLIAQTKNITYKNNENVNEVISNYIYNSSNQLTEIDYYLGFVTTYTYDSKGDLIKMLDNQVLSTNTIVYTYDTNHRKITETGTNVSESGTTTMSFTYAYDSHNNVIKQSSTISGKTTTVNTTYVYDADGYVTSYTKDDGSSATYTYSTL